MAGIAKQHKEAASRARELMQENMKRLNGTTTAVATPEGVRDAPLPEPPVLQAQPEPEHVEEVVETVEQPELPDWEQRWKTADGMLKQQGAEFRRAKAEMEAARRKAEEEAAALRAQMEELQMERERSRPVTQDEVQKYFTREQIERLGEDECRDMLTRMRLMAEDANKVTRQSVQRELQGAVKELQAEKQNLAQLRQDQFWNTVDSLVPEWRSVDTSPEFMAWLEEVDPLSGYTRRDLGVSARDSLDAKRFAAIYTAFQKSQTKSTTVATPKRVLPNGVPPASAQTTASAKPAPVSVEEIREYKAKMARGYYKTRPKEMERDRARVLSAMPSPR